MVARFMVELTLEEAVALKMGVEGSNPDARDMELMDAAIEKIERVQELAHATPARVLNRADRARKR